MSVPIRFAANGSTIGGVNVSVDFDQSLLTFDPTDGDGDGIPDAITFSVVPAAAFGFLTAGLNGTTGDIDIVIADIAPPIATLQDGIVVTITFMAGSPTSTTTAFVNCSQTTAAAFSSTTGQNVQGTCTDGSVEIDVPPPILPDIDATPTALDFGMVLVNTTAPAQTVTVRNTGMEDLAVGTLALAGTDAAFFGLANTCDGVTLAPMATCTTMVTFSPTEARAYTAMLTIPSNDPDENPFTVALSGTGALAPPDIDAMPTALDFGMVVVNTTAPAQTVTVRNTGMEDLAVGTLALAGTDAAFFGLANTCDGVTLAPMATCTTMVTFSPTEARAYTAMLTIPSNDPDENPFTVALSGTGIPVPVPDIEVMATALDFGTVLINTTAPAQTVTVRNTGMESLEVGTLALAGTDAAFFNLASNTCDGVTLAPMATCTTMVTFSPTEARAYTAMLTIPSDDPDENPFMVALSGTGFENRAPTANAGPDQTVAIPAGATTVNVTLDGSASSDADPGDTIASFLWTGTPDPADVAQPTVALGVGTHTFTLMVTDNLGASSTADTVVITVNPPPPNQAPTANAGADRTVTIPAGATTVNVTLDGSASSDADPGDGIASFLWTGTPNPADVAQPTVTLGVGTHTFTLVVTDMRGQPSTADTVVITVPNRPPVANAQTASTAANTPVNITLTGSDPDGRPVTFSIVTQPTNGTLSGTAPNVTYTPAADFAGTDTFTFRVNDGTANSPAATVTVNVASPEINIITPANGQTVSGNAVTVAAEVASDAGVTEVLLQYRAVGTSGFVNIGTGSAPGFFAPWNTRALADGAYDLRATATSASGTTLNSGLVRVTVDNPPFTTTPDIVENTGNKTETVAADEEAQIMTADGVIVMIPAGALESNARITVAVIAALPALNPEAGDVVGMPIDFTLDNQQTTFGEPLTIIIPYEDENQDGVVDGTNPPINETDLTMWFFNTAGAWEQVTDAQVRPDDNVIVGQVDHFTTFALFQAAEPVVAPLDDGGGCALMPAGPFGLAHLLAALGNILLPVAVLMALRVWSWRRERR